MIISRYLTKEVFNALLAVTFVLLLVFISQTLVRYLSYAASGKIAANLLLQIVGFEVPNLLALLLPLGLFLGIILTYSRLYADNELRVLHACGLTPNRLTGITCVLAIFVTLVISLLMLWINPAISVDKQKILASGSVDNLLGTLMPGRFQVSSDGKRVVYVEKISRNHKEAENIFVAQQEKNDADETGTPWVVLSAADGHQMVDQENQQVFIVADNGNRYEGIPGQNNYKIIQFKRYAVRMPDVAFKSQREIHESIATKKLFEQYKDPAYASELQWRIAIPITAFLLALLAIPLSQVKPRQGRFSALFPAILIYVVYMNLLFAGRNLIEQKMVSTLIGLWWIHLIALSLVIGLMWNWRARS